MLELQQHLLSAAFPAMSDEDFQSLKDSIENIGQQEMIIEFEGMILDGWHRYRACLETNTTPEIVEMPAGTDPQDFVLAKNASRRHLSASQRAMAIAAVFDWRPVGRPVAENNSTPSVELKTTKELAEIAGTGTTAITEAKAVQAKGTDEVKQAVRDGKVSAKRGANISKLPPEQQAAALAEPLEPKAKPQRITAPQAEPDSSGDNEFDAIAELEAAHHELTEAHASIKAMEQRIAIITKPDLAAELSAQLFKFDQLNGRLQQAITTGNEAAKQARYYGEILSKIRGVLGVEKNGEILGCLMREAA